MQGVVAKVEEGQLIYIYIYARCIVVYMQGVVAIVWARAAKHAI